MGERQTIVEILNSQPDIGRDWKQEMKKRVESKNNLLKYILMFKIIFVLYQPWFNSETWDYFVDYSLMFITCTIQAESLKMKWLY